ncbi:MAG: hydrogen peroxide-inducible genes activator [Caulobacteraceae bacterium]|nr:hydrogen peroxide-inducible genes activator [Caulobacter sp.]
MLPTLRQLQYLTLLARHGSFSKAAQAAHVSQPTLSSGIQELERVLGGAVVDRARSGVVLTAVGEAAAGRAAELLAAAEDLVQAAQAAGRPLCGRFRLGVIPTVAPFLLPRALPALRARFPGLRLFLREEQTARLGAALRSGELDAALIALPADTAGLQTAPVGDDALVAAVPADHPLTGREVVDADDMADEELILLEDGHCLRDHALAACRVEGRASGHETAFAATSLATLVQMVGAGLGVTLLPAMAAQAGLAERAEVVTRPLADAGARREIVVAWRAGSSRGVEARLLAETLREA